MKGECAILGDVITQILNCAKVLASNIKNSSGRVKQGLFAIVAVVAIVASLSFTGTRIAYKVNYSGNIIATVSHKNHFDAALKLVVRMVGNDEVKTAVEQPSFSTAIVLNDEIDNAQQVAHAIIDNTDAIVEASTLYINGNPAITAEKATIDVAIQNRLDDFDVEGVKCDSYFADEVTTQIGYYMESEIEDKNDVSNVVNSLSVITEMNQTEDIVVPYESVVEESDKYQMGYSKVKISGVAGVNRITRNLVMLNGEIQSSTDIGTDVVVAPVNEVVLKGTAKIASSSEVSGAGQNSGFIFPLPAGVWQLSCGFGGNGGHKAIDFRAPSGTPIYAVAAGRVVFSGWDGTYGYCVVVEHADGTRTRYAHARQLCCNVGDIVSQGQVIALVGTTGLSTGNHLHFEVIVGGRLVNPAHYINIR
ncbi:MAG: peptidoglycan DD-metalloendopeptidase family protein [Clostridia bacterium]|nr:peptidoglycan DD-metalloendopeptidase family protein [Clostridia bacterium]